MYKTDKNTTAITFDQFVERIDSKLYRIKGYYSLYITPSGEILDCRIPQDFGHNDFCVEVYKHLEELPEKPFNSNLRSLAISFEEVAYYLMDYFSLLDVMYVDANLYTKIDKVLLGTEDRICQDMGFVKLAINTKHKTFEIVVPNPIFEKRVTGAQQDIITKLSTVFNMNIDERLKTEQKDNMIIAIQIEDALSKLKKATT